MTTTRVQQVSDGEELVFTDVESGSGEDTDPRDLIPGRRSSTRDTGPSTPPARGAPSTKVRRDALSGMKQVMPIVAGVLLLGLAPSAWAQSGIPTRSLPGATSALAGTVVSSITTALVLRDDGGSDHTFFVDNTSALPAGLVPGTRVNVKFEVLKGGRAHLISVGTSYAMDASQGDGQPQESSAATPRPSAEPMDPPAKATALSSSGLSESASWPNRDPVRGDPRPHDSGSTLPNVLATVTLSLGAAVAFWWARRAL
jgi:hypothetical protein